jgi:hypothetical protein
VQQPSLYERMRLAPVVQRIIEMTQHVQQQTHELDQRVAQHRPRLSR